MSPFKVHSFGDALHSILQLLAANLPRAIIKEIVAAGLTSLAVGIHHGLLTEAGRTSCLYHSRSEFGKAVISEFFWRCSVAYLIKVIS